MGWCAGFLGRTYSTRICPDLYEGALAEAEILIAKQIPAVSRITHLNNLSWPNAPLSRTNKQFQAIHSLDLHQVGSSQSYDGEVVTLPNPTRALVAATREIST